MRSHSTPLVQFVKILVTAKDQDPSFCFFFCCLSSLSALFQLLISSHLPLLFLFYVSLSLFLLCSCCLLYSSSVNTLSTFVSLFLIVLFCGSVQIHLVLKMKGLFLHQLYMLQFVLLSLMVSCFLFIFIFLFCFFSCICYNNMVLFFSRFPLSLYLLLEYFEILGISFCVFR